MQDGVIGKALLQILQKDFGPLGVSTSGQHQRRERLRLGVLGRCIQRCSGVLPGIRLAKLDTEAEPEIAARFGIRSIPTLIAFKNGREVARRSGASDLSGLLGWIKGSV